MCLIQICKFFTDTSSGELHLSKEKNTFELFLIIGIPVLHRITLHLVSPDLNEVILKKERLNSKT